MIDKRQWFDLPDSLVEREDGKGSYYNVEARFSDHPVYNAQKSNIARHNVYDIGIVLHTRVKRAGGDAPAQKNMSALVIRFDKGEDKTVTTAVPSASGVPVLHREGTPGMSKDDYNTAMKAIARCWDAWEHYQKFRQSPVTDLEKTAIKQILASPDRPKGVLVDIDGTLERKNFDPDADIDEEQAEEEERLSRARVAPKAPRKKKAAA